MSTSPTLHVIGATELLVKAVENCAFLQLNMMPFGLVFGPIAHVSALTRKCLCQMSIVHILLNAPFSPLAADLCVHGAAEAHIWSILKF